MVELYRVRRDKRKAERDFRQRFSKLRKDKSATAGVIGALIGWVAIHKK